MGTRQVFLCGLILCGCTGSQGDVRRTGKVSGKLTCQGVPVTQGMISFSPITRNERDRYPGKAAQGLTNAKGEYSLSTYELHDGAVLGKHVVKVGTSDPKIPLPGAAADDLQFEVKSGENTFNIDLTPLTGAPAA